MNKRTADKIIRSVFAKSPTKPAVVWHDNPTDTHGDPVLAGIVHIVGVPVLVVNTMTRQLNKGSFRLAIGHEKAHLDTGYADTDPRFHAYCAARKLPYWIVKE